MKDELDADILIGGYGEIRPFYSTDSYKNEGNHGNRWRTQHLGTDFWIEADTPIHTFYDGVILSVSNNNQHLDYGYTVIVKHKINDIEFYTLYGHLSSSCVGIVKEGQSIVSGEIIGHLGAMDENGGWPPHLHFQIMLDLLGNTTNFPGVAYPAHFDIWKSICPEIPIKEAKSNAQKALSISDIKSKRAQYLAKNLSVSYHDPLHIVRGYRQYLYSADGRRYIDMVNNVAHVGHEHPHVVKSISQQVSVLNTNTRYLHDNLVNYAERLIEKSPDPLEVVFFVNSGSEANELALRLAKTYTAQKDVLALKVGYHGNSGGCVNVSSYKFEGKGGFSTPEHTHILSMPEIYHGNGNDASHYSDEVRDMLTNMSRKPAAFLSESIMSCGGQVVFPKGYLKQAYEYTRAQGGLCIADEVQTGFGRVGKHFWAFELQGVVPDIVTCGKPIGNGHPLGAVITTKAVADAFANGMEYFNTYGGNPVSCAAGMAVLDVIEQENLQEHALQLGDYFKKELNQLKEKFDIIGDVRGEGLFIGIELVKDRETKEPAEHEATYLVNRMRRLGILLSTDGPFHNVVKIKPPMCLEKKDVDDCIKYMNRVFHEDFMKVQNH